MLSTNLFNQSRILLAVFVTALFLSISTMSGATLNGGNVAIDADLPALASGPLPGLGGS